MIFRKFYLYILLPLLGIFSCAQPGTLTGGDKDSLPPVLKASNPAMFDTGFREKKLVVAFDEFFDLKNIETEFYTSPPLKEKPDFKVKKRRLVIKLKETLRDSMTYSFCFGDAVVDYHEANPIKNFKYIFSTGKTVDSLSVSGKILDSYTHLPVKSAYVMLYDTHSDSMPLKEKPLYIAKTDTSGIFNCDFIAPGKYKLFVLEDLNSNLIFDIPEEKIAFSDSLMFPSVKKTIVTDTFKLTKIDPKTKKKKFLRDSVVHRETNVYSPNELRFFTFTENKIKQFHKSAERPLPGQCVFVYNKPLENPNIVLDGFDNSKIIKEYGKNRDSLVVWISDSLIYRSDSLRFFDRWQNIDSLGKFVAETDTSILTQSLKEVKNKSRKKLKKRDDITEIQFPGKEIDLNSPYSFICKIPPKFLDSSKLALFSAYDTAVFDAKKQSLKKIVRLSGDKILAVFARPVVKEFALILENDKKRKDWYTSSFTKNRDSVVCTITDKDMANIDTLKLLVKYDNDFYLNQIQQFEDSASLAVVRQKIISVERKLPDIISLKFEKAPGKNFQVKISDKTERNFYTFLHNAYDETAVLKITNPEIASIDSFEISFSVPDFVKSNGDTVFFESAADAVFMPEKMFVRSAKRFEKNFVTIAFSASQETMPEIKPINFPAGSQIKKSLNKSKDTLTLEFPEASVSNKDSLKFELLYQKRNQLKKTEKQSESFSLPTEKINIAKKEKEKITVTVELPQKLCIASDSASVRRFFINSDFKPGKKYILKMDSDAVFDIFGHKNLRSVQNFSVREKKFYGRIVLNLTNIAAPEQKDFYLRDDAKKDSTLHGTIAFGQVLVNLTDEKGNILQTRKMSGDGNITFELLHPKKYGLFLVYDKNKNDKWDTGDYLKKNQPEITVHYRKSVVVKSKFDTQIDWRIDNED